MKANNKSILGLLNRAKIYGLPEEKLREILLRDKNCIFCGIKMKTHVSSIGTPRDKKTIEHFSNKAEWGEAVDVGICCGSCNSSKSNKKIFDWFKTKYCLERNINERTVAEPVKDYIKNNSKKS